MLLYYNYITGIKWSERYSNIVYPDYLLQAHTPATRLHVRHVQSSTCILCRLKLLLLQTLDVGMSELIDKTINTPSSLSLLLLCDHSQSWPE